MKKPTKLLLKTITDKLSEELHIETKCGFDSETGFVVVRLVGVPFGRSIDIVDLISNFEADHWGEFGFPFLILPD